MKNSIILFISFLIPTNIFAQEKGLDQRIDEAFQPISDIASKYVFYPLGAVSYTHLTLPTTPYV